MPDGVWSSLRSRRSYDGAKALSLREFAADGPDDFEEFSLEEIPEDIHRRVPKRKSPKKRKPSSPVDPKHDDIMNVMSEDEHRFFGNEESRLRGIRSPVEHIPIGYQEDPRIEQYVSRRPGTFRVRAEDA